MQNGNSVKALGRVWEPEAFCWWRLQFRLYPRMRLKVTKTATTFDPLDSSQHVPVRSRETGQQFMTAQESNIDILNLNRKSADP
jgi:hypothetical protein